MFGYKPYDVKLKPAENRAVNMATMGEGFHNYHHTFPWDYAASEFGSKFGLTTWFINAAAKVDWAYDLRTATPQQITLRRSRTGDKSIR